MKLNRKNRLLIGLCTAAGILIIKLFSIQILNDEYKKDALNNSMVYTTIYPTRGIIHDRNGEILVGNKVAYDLMVTPHGDTSRGGGVRHPGPEPRPECRSGIHQGEDGRVPPLPQKDRMADSRNDQADASGVIYEVR